MMAPLIGALRGNFEGASALPHSCLYEEISDRKPDPRSYGNAVAQHFVVEDTEKYCSVIDAPSKDLKVLGQRQGYGSRAQAETALKGLNCKALPG